VSLVSVRPSLVCCQPAKRSAELSSDLRFRPGFGLARARLRHCPDRGADVGGTWQLITSQGDYLRHCLIGICGGVVRLGPPPGIHTINWCCFSQAGFRSVTSEGVIYICGVTAILNSEVYLAGCSHAREVFESFPYFWHCWNVAKVIDLGKFIVLHLLTLFEFG